MGSTVSSFGDFVSSLGNFVPTMTLMGDRAVWSKALYFGVQLALIAFFDTLLTSVLIDTITKEPTNRIKELFAQGFSTIVAAFSG